MILLGFELELPSSLQVFSGYLVVDSGYLVVTSSYLTTTTTGYFSLGLGIFHKTFESAIKPSFW